jgi:hypothetical protein
MPALNPWQQLNNRVTTLESYHEYSTTERVVGKWVDGKDIYERTYAVTANGNTLTVATDEPIDALIDFRGYLKIAAGDCLFISSRNADLYTAETNPSYPTGYFYSELHNTSFYNSSGYYTLQYTKAAPTT